MAAAFPMQAELCSRGIDGMAVKLKIVTVWCRKFTEPWVVILEIKELMTLPHPVQCTLH